MIALIRYSPDFFAESVVEVESVPSLEEAEKLAELRKALYKYSAVLSVEIIKEP